MVDDSPTAPSEAVGQGATWADGLQGEGWCDGVEGEGGGGLAFRTGIRADR